MSTPEEWAGSDGDRAASASGPGVVDRVDAAGRSAAERLPRSTAGRSAVAALTFGVVGGLAGLLVVGGVVLLLAVDGLPPSPDVETLGIALGLPLSAGVGAAVVGGGTWWALVERRDTPSLGRGLAVGAATGSLAHPVTWLAFFAGVAAYVATEEGPAALVEVVVDSPAELAGVYLLLTVFGFLLTAALTVPAGVLTGLGLAYVRDRVPAPHERDGVRDW